MITTNQKAFLDMIAISEIGKDLLAVSDNGYNVMVGSSAHHPLLFQPYDDHPRVYNSILRSTAAGRYQILQRNYDFYKKMLNLPDFGPDSQDAIALQLIKECHALDDIEAGNMRISIALCSREWASLPGNSYGQHQNKMADLINCYLYSGGIVA